MPTAELTKSSAKGPTASIPSAYTNLAKLIDIIAMLRAENEYLTPQMAQMLFLIAQRPGLTSQQLSDLTGLAISSISRNLTALGEWHRLGKEGFNLVETVQDPEERRRALAFLTSKGRTLVRRVLERLDPEVPFEAPLAREWLNKAHRAGSRPILGKPSGIPGVKDLK